MDWWFLRAWAGVALLPGCYLSHGLEEEGPPDIPGPVLDVVGPAPVDRVDLLLVADDSESMGEEQDRLRAELPRLVEVLLAGDLEEGRPGRPGAGSRDFPPIRSLRVGVVTTDLGAGGHDDSGPWRCPSPVRGDDGALQTAPAVPTTGCPGFQAAPQTFDDPDGRRSRRARRAFGEDVGCLVRVGTDGCGFEQPLEAALRAIDDGFPRGDAFLVVVFVGDEDDCSASDLELYQGRSPRYPGHFNARCVAHPEALHPIRRYADALLDAVDRPENLLVAAITGVPPDVAGGGEGTQDLEQVLADPRMTPVVAGTTVRPVCRGADGDARPGRRLVELGQAVQDAGGVGVVASICTPSLTGALDPLVRALGAALDR